MATGHVRQELHNVGTHRVVVEVMLDGPQRLEAELHREITELQLLAVHLVIGECVERILEHGRVADVHGVSFALEADR